MCVGRYMQMSTDVGAGFTAGFAVLCDVPT